MAKQKSVLEKVLANKTELAKKVKEHELTYEEIKKKERKRLEENPLMTRKSLDPVNGIGKLLIRLESMGGGVEKHYFWLMRFLTGTKAPQYAGKGFTGFGINAIKVYKLKDQFDASVSSSFHGQIGSKVSQIQQQVSTYLAQIGQMTKTLFPIVREIRIMDERLEYYKDSFWDKKEADGDDKERAREAEIALKSTWVEVVEQGVQSPNSVYSMGTKLGFITLPDLFFSINPDGTTPEEQRDNMTKYLKQMHDQKEINKKVLDALRKKLYQYFTWKQKTWHEMEHTYKFRIKNLRQHYNVVKLYMSWLKPLLTTLKRLQMQSEDDTALVSAFETSKLELELLAVIGKGKIDVEKKNNKYNACIMVRLTHVTKPEMSYTQGGQKQPTHMGDTIIEYEPYVVTDEQIEDYRKHCDDKLLELIPGEEMNMVKDVMDAMDSLGTDVRAYLLQAEGVDITKDDDEEEKELDFFAPVKGLFDSFKIFVPDFKKKDEDDDGKIVYKGEKQRDLEREKKGLVKKASGITWNVYDIFKKANGLLTP